MTQEEVKSRSGANSSGYTYASLVRLTSGAPTLSYNNAYRKFVDGLGADAGLGVSLVEANQAVSMISSRALQLLRFTNALRKGDIVTAARTLSLDPREKRVKKIVKKYYRNKRGFFRRTQVSKGDTWEQEKTLANVWLEFHFGWAPLVGSIYDSIEALEQLDPTHTLKGRGYASDTVTQYGTGANYNRNKTVMKTLLQADVFCENRNLALMQRMGVVNPASLLWEIVPFSFVADWFSNVGEFLASFTDFAGIGLRRAFVTTYKVIDSSTYVAPPYYRLLTGVIVEVRRTPVTAFARPIPALKPFRGFSVSRGATAIGLLLQAMPFRRS